VFEKWCSLIQDDFSIGGNSWLIPVIIGAVFFYDSFIPYY
jgi:hypothetical protein